MAASLMSSFMVVQSSFAQEPNYFSDSEVSVDCDNRASQDGYPLTDVKVDGQWSKEYFYPDSQSFYYYAFNITEQDYIAIKEQCASGFIPIPHNDQGEFNIFRIRLNNGNIVDAPGFRGMRY